MGGSGGYPKKWSGALWPIQHLASADIRCHPAMPNLIAGWAMSIYALPAVMCASVITPVATDIACPFRSAAKAGPKCQQVQRERWIQARESELLPATYFHVIFTLPEALNRLCLYQPAVVYKLLFDTAWSVMKSFTHDKKHLALIPE